MAADNFVDQSRARQNRIQSFAFVIGSCVCFLLCSCFVLSSLLWLEQPCGFELDERINPNDAPLGSLVRLPGIGIGRACAIVAYREYFGGSNKPAFETVDDLRKVSGIGAKTVENISEWVRFERE